HCPYHAIHSFPTRRSSDLRSCNHREMTACGKFSRRDERLLSGRRSDDKNASRTARPPDSDSSSQVRQGRFEQSGLHVHKTTFGRDRKSTRLNSSHVSISYA